MIYNDSVRETGAYFSLEYRKGHEKNGGKTMEESREEYYALYDDKGNCLDSSESLDSVCFWEECHHDELFAGDKENSVYYLYAWHTEDEMEVTKEYDLSDTNWCRHVLFSIAED